MTEIATAEPDVLFERRGQLGLITLNRPKAINALNHAMVLQLSAALARWANDDAVRTVAITGAGDRGLCAGGDIVALYDDATTGDGSAAADFWFDEYSLNAQIKRYPKPIVAIQDGVVLGGGIGISAHASHRVVTERSRLGLPEVGIGFVPDVGATWLLSRAPGGLGVYLALTAGSVRAADAIAVGLSDVFVAADRIPRLLGVLEHADPSEATLLLAEDPGEAPLRHARGWIDPAFESDGVEEILERLRASGVPEAERAADEIAAKSPLALAATLESLRRAATLSSLEDALRQEYRVSRRMHLTADFAEGVRAQVIDKDRDPHWASADGIDAETVASLFLPLDDRELTLDDPATTAK